MIAGILVHVACDLARGGVWAALRLEGTCAALALQCTVAHLVVTAHVAGGLEQLVRWTDVDVSRTERACWLSRSRPSTGPPEASASMTLASTAKPSPLTRPASMHARTTTASNIWRNRSLSRNRPWRLTEKVEWSGTLSSRSRRQNQR